MVPALTATQAWPALQERRRALADVYLRDLFARDPQRFERFSVGAAGVFFDYSKQRIDAAARDALLALVDERRVPRAIEAMFAGERINTSEDRAAWHVALRAPAGAGYPEAVRAVLAQMAEFVAAVRGGAWRGFDNQPIRDVVNIGIGGSDLGPRLVYDALAPRAASPKVQFVANVDPDELDDGLAGLDPATTLFVIVSKSFTTAETLANARAAKAWLLAGGAQEADVERHFVAVSTNRDAVRAFGIARCFEFWDWVGGRFSLWSAVGLSAALGLGMGVFESLLAGAHAMDVHFRSAAPAANLPVLLALVGFWNRNLLGYPSLAVAPYAKRLALFPAWLQQVEMESNGKCVDAHGAPLAGATAPVVWGGAGTNAQHAFFQMLHQGSDVLPVDFILPLPRAAGSRANQLTANCLAQSQALMQGQSAQDMRGELAAGGLTGAALEAAAAARRCPGDRPSSTLLLERLDPACLGALLAAYEHKVFVQGLLWGINSFDQWGVELGKTLAQGLLAALEGGGNSATQDGSTAGLLARVQRGLGA